MPRRLGVHPATRGSSTMKPGERGPNKKGASPCDAPWFLRAPAEEATGKRDSQTPAPERLHAILRHGGSSWGTGLSRGRATRGSSRGFLRLRRGSSTASGRCRGGARHGRWRRGCRRLAFVLVVIQEEQNAAEQQGQQRNQQQT